MKTISGDLVFSPSDLIDVLASPLAFILDRNRINVAISRAQCLAVVVADPRIAGTAAGSIDEMMLVNLFCKLTDSSTAS